MGVGFEVSYAQDTAQCLSRLPVACRCTTLSSSTMSAHMYVGACGDQKRMSDLLKLEVQMAVR